MRWFLLVALVAFSCKSKSASDKSGAASSGGATTTETSSGKAAMSKFTLAEAGNESNKVTVEFAVPASWSKDPSGPQPSWKTDGAVTLTLVTVDAGGSNDAERIAHAAKMQFEDQPAPTRTEYPDGRVFMTQPDGNRTHARMFVPYPGGVVMGFAMLTDKSKLDGVKAAFETIKVTQ